MDRSCYTTGIAFALLMMFIPDLFCTAQYFLADYIIQFEQEKPKEDAEVKLVGREIQVKRGLNGKPRFIGFGKEAESIIVANPGFDKNVSSLQIADGTENWFYPWRARTSGTCAISPDGKILVDIKLEGPLKTHIAILNAETGKEVHADSGTAVVKTVFGSENDEFMTIGLKSIQFWRINSDGKVEKGKTLTKDIPTALRDATPDLKRMLAITVGDRYAVWELGSKKPVSVMSGQEKIPLETAISRCGKWVTRRSAAGNLQVWNAETGKALPKFVDSAVTCSTISSDGKLLAIAIDCAKPPGEIAFFKLSTGRKVLTLDLQEGNASAIAFSPGADRFAATSAGAWYVWELKEKASPK